MPTSNTDKPLDQDISYSQASQAQHTQALRWLADYWSKYFPQLSELHWWQAYHQCQPDIWIMDGELTIAYNRLLQIIAWVTLIHGPIAGQKDYYKAASVHLADQVNGFVHDIEKVLVTHEESTTPQAAEAYLQILRRMLPRDLVAIYLRPLTNFSEWREKETQQDPLPYLKDIFTWLPERTAELVVIQWQSLREWLSLEHNQLRPWDIDLFSHDLKWPPLLVQRILYGPEEPAQHPEIFTLERLTRLQVLLLSHRFSLPNCPFSE